MNSVSPEIRSINAPRAYLPEEILAVFESGDIKMFDNLNPT
jgi:hypothetical protein